MGVAIATGFPDSLGAVATSEYGDVPFEEELSSALSRAIVKAGIITSSIVSTTRERSSILAKNAAEGRSTKPEVFVAVLAAVLAAAEVFVAVLAAVLAAAEVFVAVLAAVLAVAAAIFPGKPTGVFAGIFLAITTGKSVGASANWRAVANTGAAGRGATLAAPVARLLLAPPGITLQGGVLFEPILKLSCKVRSALNWMPGSLAGFWELSGHGEPLYIL